MSQGRIYISSAFTNLKYSKCKSNSDWLDNDPHFWKQPPTWGICRTDFRKNMNKNDYVFYVLPKNAELPQMIYAYLKIKDIRTHEEAYGKFKRKRMHNGNPNGNIIVDENGNYNRYDLDIHKSKFEEIKKYYIVGDRYESRKLGNDEIIRLSNSFLNTLNLIFNTNQEHVIRIIGRKGRVLNKNQITYLLRWINTNHQKL